MGEEASRAARRVAAWVATSLLAATAMPAPAGETIYLSPTGDDAAPGTRAAPRKSFGRAFEGLRPGDTLVLLAGVHAATGRIAKGIRLNGTKDAPIVVRGETGAVLRSGWTKGDDRARQIALMLERVAHVRFEGLEIQGGGFTVAGSHVTIRDCHIHDYSNYAVITWTARHLLVENCRIHGSAHEHGIYLSKDSKDVTIRGCEIFDTAINGVHINSPGIERVTVEGNVFHHNSREWGACVTVMGARDVTIRNNVFFANLGHVFTITGKKNRTPRDVRIVHNTVYRPAGRREGQVFVVRCRLERFLVRNNIFCANARALDIRAEQIVESTDFDFNVYGPAAGRQVRELGRGEHSLFHAAVRFAKPPTWKDTTCDLHLRSGSPGSTSAAALPKGLAPCGRGGRPRKPGGPFGAYATVAE